MLNLENTSSKPVEIIEDTLYWIASEDPPKSDSEAYYFGTDSNSELKYNPFHLDFGPLNLAMTHRFGCELTKLLFEKRGEECKIFHYSNKGK